MCKEQYLFESVHAFIGAGIHLYTTPKPLKLKQIKFFLKYY